MLQFIKKYFTLFKFPSINTREQELEQLVREMYKWTRYKNTDWSLRAKKLLDLK